MKTPSSTLILMVAFIVASIQDTCRCEEEITAKRGGTAYMTCGQKPPANKSLPFAVEWFKEGRHYPIYIKIGRYASQTSRAFQGRFDYIVGNATLRISDVRVDDEGKYACMLLMVDDRISDKETRTDPKRKWIKLTVNEPPVFQRTPPNLIKSQRGDILSLSCSVVGRPEPRVTWQKDGFLIQSNAEKGWKVHDDTLVISSVRRLHRGEYTCRGSNVEGDVVHKTTVLVYAPPTLDTPPKNITAKEGLSALFTCRASGYPENITYTWFYNDKSIAQLPQFRNRYKLQTDGNLILQRISKDNSGAKLTCVASNTYQPNPNATAYLTVRYAARVINHSSVIYGGVDLPLTVKCETLAEPPTSTITWRRQGRQITSYDESSRVFVDDRGNLQFRNVSRMDEVSYSCTPYNIIGTAGESPPMKLVVRMPPRVIQQPPQIIRTREGQAFNATCRGMGEPPPYVYWEQQVIINESDEKEWIRRSNGDVLVIHRALKADSGTWRCIVKNAILTMTRQMQVKVLGTTPHIPTNITVTTQSTSAVISWIPGFDGGLTQHFLVWYKRAEDSPYTWLTKFSERQSYEIPNLKPETVYEFLVLPSNSIGSGNFSRTVLAETKAVPSSKTYQVPPEYVAPPSGLTFSLTRSGLVELRWNASYLDASKLIGFIIEYKLADEQRWAEVTTAMTSPPEVEPRGRRQKRDEEVAVQPFPFKWAKFEALDRNESSYVIQNDKGIYRGYLYMFRIIIMCIGPNIYTQPSQSITVDTSDLMEYPVYKEPVKDSNTMIISGIVAGVLVMLLITTCFIVCCYLHRRSRKDPSYQRQRINEDGYKHILTVKKSNSKNSMNSSENMRCLDHEIISEKQGGSSSQQQQQHSRTNEEVKKVFNHKSGSGGMFPRLKRKFSRSRGGSGSGGGPTTTKKTTAFKSSSMTSQSLSKDSKMRCHSSLKATSNTASHHRTQPTPNDKTSILRRHSTIVTTTDPSCMRSNRHRPLSDCYLSSEVRTQTLLYTGGGASPIEEEDEESPDAGPRYEIDCSQSDVEVRCLSRSTLANNKHHTSVRHSMVPLTTYDGLDYPRAHYISLKELSYEGGSYQHLHHPLQHHHRITGYATTTYKDRPPLGPHRWQHGVDSTMYGTWSQRSQAVPIPDHRHHPLHGGHHDHWLRMDRPHHPIPIENSNEQLSNSDEPLDGVIEQTTTDNNNGLCSVPESPYTPPPSDDVIPVHGGDDDEEAKNLLMTSSSSLSFRPSMSMPSLSPRHQMLKDTLASTSSSQQQHTSSPSHRMRSLSGDDLLSHNIKEGEEVKGPYHHQRRNQDEDSGFTSTMVDSPSFLSTPPMTSSSSTANRLRQPQLNDVISASSSSGYESRNASASSSSESSSTHLRHVALRQHRGGSSRPASLSFNDEAAVAGMRGGQQLRYHTYDRHRSVSTSSFKTKSVVGGGAPESSSSSVVPPTQTDDNGLLHNDKRTLTLSPLPMLPSEMSSGKKDTSSVDEKYEWDSENAIKYDILDALQKYEAHNRQKPKTNAVEKEIDIVTSSRHDSTTATTLPSLFCDETFQSITNNEHFLDGDEDEEEAAGTAVDDSNYSKESMEKRCAALKQEYRQYKFSQGMKIDPTTTC